VGGSKSAAGPDGLAEEVSVMVVGDEGRGSREGTKERVDDRFLSARPPTGGGANFVGLVTSISSVDRVPLVSSTTPSTIIASESEWSTPGSGGGGVLVSLLSLPSSSSAVSSSSSSSRVISLASELPLILLLIPNGLLPPVPTETGPAPADDEEETVDEAEVVRDLFILSSMSRSSSSASSRASSSARRRDQSSSDSTSVENPRCMGVETEDPSEELLEEMFWGRWEV